MFADAYIFVCSSHGDPLPTFFVGKAVSVFELWGSKSTNLYMYIDDLIHFIHVCQEFDKETYFGTRVCQRIKSHGSSKNPSENFFYQNCSSLRTRHTYSVGGS